MKQVKKLSNTRPGSLPETASLRFMSAFGQNGLKIAGYQINDRPTVAGSWLQADLNPEMARISL